MKDIIRKSNTGRDVLQELVRQAIRQEIVDELHRRSLLFSAEDVDTIMDGFSHETMKDLMQQRLWSEEDDL